MHMILSHAALATIGLIAGLTAAAISTALIPPRYEATASVMISASPTAPADNAAKTSDVATAQNLGSTVARVAESREVAAGTSTALGIPVDRILHRVSAESELGLQIVTVTAWADNPGTAAAIANSTVEVLSQVCASLRLGADSGVTVAPFDRAGGSNAPTFPKPPLNYALGGLAGLLTGLGIASLRRRVDNRFRSLAEIEGELGLPAIGAIGRLPRRRPRPALSLYARPDVARSVNGAVAALSVLNPSKRRLRVVVAGVTDDGSASFVASLLAVGLAHHNARTTLVDGLSGTHTIAPYFPAEPDGSDVPGSKRRPAGGAMPTVLHGDLLRPKERARPANLAAFVESLSIDGTVVVTTSPPVSDGVCLSTLARHADVVLLAMASDWTGKAEAHRAALLVARLGVPSVGLVVIGTAARAVGTTPSVWPVAAPVRLVPGQPVRRQPATPAAIVPREAPAETGHLRTEEFAGAVGRHQGQTQALPVGFANGMFGDNPADDNVDGPADHGPSAAGALLRGRSM
jgi:capsular polysaccharide biosynthesis protein